VYVYDAILIVVFDFKFLWTLHVYYGICYTYM
jgi:hypothetical protein